MAKLFLRSGSLDAVLPLGENGQPIYLSALQLRETLRLRKQQHIADCLAIPQPDDAGNRLDWYAPIGGKVTSWAAASDSARNHALNQLVACQQVVAEMCQRAQQSEKSNQKLFGALLAKALQFPDQNFVYLVDGKPVLTFWGFVSLDKKSRQDSLDCLRKVEEDHPPLSLSKLAVAVPPPPAVAPPLPEPVTVTVVEETQPQPEAEQAMPAPETAPVVQKVVMPATSRPLLRYGWMLPAAALLIAFGVQLKGYFSAPAEVSSPSQAHADKTSAQPQTLAAPTAPAVVASQPAQPAVPDTTKHIALPVTPASVAATAQQSPDNTAPQPVQPAASAGEETAAAAPAKDDLILPGDAVKLGSTRFLNGNWRVVVGGKNPLTGKPPSLRYQLKNGKGIARMTQGDGIICKVDVYAGLMKSGNLVINSRTKAKCSDGSRYQMPDLTCKQGANGAAECSGQYDAGTVLPMTMKRESK
ncbi:SrfA family protein [Erwinia mallotivora]|uniref:Virulence effector protein n=1 Tax=Erwinia mallotivora TaxID=69222 RepID=A0A014NSR6_9GAMM|nr:SrfA family protein [Erwinia mallotivora]EXU76905.1 virulence effector protein [Erwinia mallotivora]